MPSSFRTYTKKWCPFEVISQGRYSGWFHTGMLRPRSGPLTLSHTKYWKIGTLSHTWSSKRHHFQAEHPHVVHHREYPFPRVFWVSMYFWYFLHPWRAKTRLETPFNQTTVMVEIYIFAYFNKSCGIIWEMADYAEEGRYPGCIIPESLIMQKQIKLLAEFC